MIEFIILLVVKSLMQIDIMIFFLQNKKEFHNANVKMLITFWGFIR